MTGYPADPLAALDAADAAFRLLTAGPQPRAVHAARLAGACRTGWSPRSAAVLLHPATGPRARNRAWAELIHPARTGAPAWVIGLTGIALPGDRKCWDSN